PGDTGVPVAVGRIAEAERVEAGVLDPPVTELSGDRAAPVALLPVGVAGVDGRSDAARLAREACDGAVVQHVGRIGRVRADAELVGDRVAALPVDLPEVAVDAALLLRIVVVDEADVGGRLAPLVAPAAGEVHLQIRIGEADRGRPADRPAG